MVTTQEHLHRMNRRGLTQDDFDCMLNWLDPNRTKAGEKYEQIRNGLIAIFNYKGCINPEELADETIDRVARRVKDIKDSYEGDPSRYFYGVGKKISLEYLKRTHPCELPLVLEAPQTEDVEQQYQCLDECMEKLTVRNRALILQYYSGQKRAKIDSRSAIRGMLNLKPSALRVRVFRIRAGLEKCVSHCLQLTD